MSHLSVAMNKRPRTRSLDELTGQGAPAGPPTPDQVAQAKATYKRLKSSAAPKAEVKAAKKRYKALREIVSSLHTSKETKKATSGAGGAAKPAKAASQGAGKGSGAQAAEPTQAEREAFSAFEQTPFHSKTMQALRDAGFKAPTPIQGQAWPALLSGCDLVAVAKTGSGKTLGFLLPAFHKLASAGAPAGGSGGLPSPQVLVIAPTRELAQQIGVEVGKFAGGVKHMCLYGGTNVAAMKQGLRKTRPVIVVATPGRLVDMLDQRALTLSRAGYVVLDEADRMLDMGFEPQMRKIFKQCPPAAQRQTLLFSATWPKSVRKLAQQFLKPASKADAGGAVDPTTITREIFVGTGADAELEANKAVKQKFVDARDHVKDQELYKLLCSLDEGYRAVVFANTKARVDKLSQLFWDEGFATCAVHGGKPQRERDAALRGFVSGKNPIMIATDVAARGLDIKGVTHVVNYDMARDVESYVHRIGRTGRAGEVGEAITFWNSDYDKPCTAALVKIARDAGQEVPDWLQRHASTKESKQWRVKNAVLN